MARWEIETTRVVSALKASLRRGRQQELCRATLPPRQGGQAWRQPEASKPQLVHAAVAGGLPRDCSQPCPEPCVPCSVARTRPSSYCRGAPRSA